MIVAYAFNDDKTKVEIYTKNDIDNMLDDKADSNDVYTKNETDDLLANKFDKGDVVVLTGSKSVEATTATDIIINRSALNEKGISDITEWQVIGITQTTGSNMPEVMNRLVNNVIYPNCLYRTDVGALTLNVYNRLTTTQTISYRIVLIKAV